MSKNTEIKADIRTKNGTGASRALRREGKIPATLYGVGEPKALAFDAKNLTKLAHSAGFMTSLLSIDVGGEKIRAIPRETQLHPLNGKIMHIDFLLLAANARIDVEVSVSFINEELSPGLKRGGVLNIVRHEVELTCPAESIPDVLIADLTGLDIGDSIHITGIKLPENVQPTIADRDFTVATIAAPAAVRSEEEEGAAAEEEGAAATADEEKPDENKGDKESSD
jgi:large subunit ribosomal protein L25